MNEETSKYCGIAIMVIVIILMFLYASGIL